MSAGAIAIAVLVFILLGAPVAFAILRDEQKKRREWRPEGYRRGREDSSAIVSDWWNKPLPNVAIRQSVRLIDAPCDAEVVSVVDPRVVGKRVSR